jgi:hypothetical protein
VWWIETGLRENREVGAGAWRQLREKNSIEVLDVSTSLLVSIRMDLQSVERLEVTGTKNKKTKSKAAPLKPKGAAPKLLDALMCAPSGKLKHLPGISIF